MKANFMWLVTLGGLLFCSAILAAPPKAHEHAMTVGKKGEFTLTQTTKVGDKVLQPGTYVVQHRVSGSDHFLRFTELKNIKVPAEGGGEAISSYLTYTEADKEGELKCKVEKAAAPINKTVVYTVDEGGTPRITKVAIKGEEVVHIL